MTQALSPAPGDQRVVLFGPTTLWSALLADRLSSVGTQLVKLPDSFDANDWNAWEDFAATCAQGDRPVTGLIAWAPELPVRKLVAMDAAGVSDDLDAALDPIVYFARHLAPLLGNGGTLTLITSSLSEAGACGNVAGAVIAGGLRMLAKSIAIEFGPRGVRSNSLHLPIDANGQLLSGRTAVTPETIASLVLFLLSPEARFVSGADIQAGSMLKGKSR